MGWEAGSEGDEVSGGADELDASALIDVLRDAASRLADVDLAGVHLHELGALLQSFESTRAVIDAAGTRMLDRFDAEGGAQWDGLRTTGSWLTHRCRMTSATASRRVRTARALRDMDVVAERHRAGRLSSDQVDAFARVLSPRTAEAMAADEELLADLADRLRPDELARELRGWADLVDADGAEPDPGHRDRGVTLVQTLDDSWSGRIDLGAADGAAVSAAITSMSDTMRRQDRRIGGPQRSAAQRRADALVELIRRGSAPVGTASSTGGAEPSSGAESGGGADRRGGDPGSDEVPTDDGRPPGETERPAAPARSPKVTLHLTLDAGDLEGGRGAVTLGGARIGPVGTDRLLCDSSIAAALTDRCGGAVLWMGRDSRVVTPSQRRALALETGGCGFPGCDAPPADCDAHHIIHWRRGGPTDLPNLVLLCWHHHHLVHEERWTVQKARDGTLSWWRPDGSLLDPRPGWRDPPEAVETRHGLRLVDGDRDRECDRDHGRGGGTSRRGRGTDPPAAETA